MKPGLSSCLSLPTTGQRLLHNTPTVHRSTRFWNAKLGIYTQPRTRRSNVDGDESETGEAAEVQKGHMSVKQAIEVFLIKVCS